MGYLKKLKYVVFNALAFVPDTLMLKFQFGVKLHRKLNLKDPKRFSDKLQWYKIYCSCKNDSKILIANRDFLLCRDITIITMMLIVLYLIFCFFKIVVLSEKVVLILIAEWIVSDISMRGKGKRLAYNVISEDIYK